MSSILEIIGHYQRSIERSQNGSDSTSNGKLLHCIDKLYRLPVTVDHLQATGIGKTVNSLRKYDGEVGVASKALVAKWKAMVTAEEYAAESATVTAAAAAAANKTDDEDNDDDDDINDDYADDVNGNNGGIDDDDGGGGGNYGDNDQTSNNNKSSINKDKNYDKKTESKHRNHSSSHKNIDNSNKKSSSREHSSSSRTSNTKSKHKSDRREEKSSQKSHNHQIDESSKIVIPKFDDNLEHSDNDEKLLKCNNDLEKNLEKHHHHSSSSSSSRDKNTKHHSSSSSKNHHHSRTDEKSTSSTSKSSSKHRKEHNRDNNHKSSSKDKDKTHHKSSNSSNCNNTNKTKENHSNNNRINNKTDDNINKDNKRRHSITDTSSDGKLCEVTSSSSSTTITSSSSNKIKKPKIIHHDEIDSTTGTSFEDALGMMIPIKLPNSTTKNTNKIKSPNISKSNNSSSTSKTLTSNSSGNCASTSSTSNKNNTSSIHKKTNGTTTPNKTDCDDIRNMTPSLLASSANLKPLDPSIALELPTISISNNYKPMPLNQTVMDCVFRSNQPQKTTRTDAEALTHSISSKTMRTKVYSGQRSGQRYQAPKLFDLCIRFLQKNIDSIEYCGGYPYEILRHFLERATPTQLLNFEEWNQYIIEDTDELWQQHVQRHCRGQKRQEMESWREMYLRVKENEEHRLNMLAENIKQSQKLVAAPVKKTQLAFVDSMVKPPRSVQRKQDQFGTNRKLIATPAARVASLCNLTPNATKTGDVRLRIAAGERDNAQVSGFIRPKKAPLMAKTLQLMKGRFKR